MKVLSQEAGYYPVSLLGTFDSLSMIDTNRENFLKENIDNIPSPIVEGTGQNSLPYLSNSGQAWIPPRNHILDPASGIKNGFAQFAEVTSVHPMHGSTFGGTEMTIRGVGFSPEIANNVVTIGPLECPVTSASDTEIICRTVSAPTPVMTAPDAAFTVGMQGLKHEVFDITPGAWSADSSKRHGDSLYSGTGEVGDPQLPADFPASPSETMQWAARGLRYDDRSVQGYRLAHNSTIRSTVHRLTGIFKPLHTAQYTFYVACDEAARFSLSEDSDNFEASAPGNIVDALGGGAPGKTTCAFSVVVTCNPLRGKLHRSQPGKITTLRLCGLTIQAANFLI